MKLNWKCVKCGAGNHPQINRCSFCSEPRPADDGERERKEAQNNETRLTQSLHNAIEKMNHHARVRTWRWLEDNII